MRKTINKPLGRIIAAVLSCVLFTFAFSCGCIYASETIDGNEIKQEEANVDDEYQTILRMSAIKMVLILL